MAGTVDVYAFQLLGPDGPISAGRPVTLRGLAPAGTTAVRIEERRADGTWAAVAVVVPQPDGSFRAARHPRRAVRLPRDRRRRAEPALPLKVGARLATTVERLKGGRFMVSATATPAQPGALAALQLYSRERFRWRQVAHARVGRDSRVSFTVSPPGRYAARVVLLRGRGGYGASVGPTRHLGGHRAQHHERRAPAPEHHHHLG